MSPTIRSRLVFLVIAAVMPLALMTLALVLLDFQRMRDAKAGDRLNTARAIAAAVDRDLSGIESGLRVLAASQLPQGDSVAAFSLEARDAMPLLHASALQLEDAAGNLVMDMRQPRQGSMVVRGGPLASSPAVAPRPVSAPGELAASGRLAQAPREQLIEVSVPLPADKAAPLQGATVLRARLSPDRLRDLLSLQQMDPDWLATVYDREGRVVARTRGAERFFGVEAPPDLLLKLRGQWEGQADTTSLDGVAVQTAFVRSEGSGWAVAISVPRAGLNSPLMRALGWLVGGFVLTITGSLLLAWRIGGRIAGAVQALTQPALALGTGVAVEVPPLGVVEVDRVGRALTHAARLLDAAQHEANHDALTGLANRSLFRQMVQQQLALARRNGTSVAVLYVDLDGFKEVNDSHGHGVGDLLLKQAAQRLRAAVRAGDLVARLGGDEFAIALVHPGPRGAAKVAAKLVQWLAEPFELGELRVSVSASIGGASAPSSPVDEPADCDALLEQADAAMYRAKQSGKSRFVLAEA
jgi:diguanylate cyclase (GGDEF)-like protein